MRYRDKSHSKLPHILKVSGGRTSGMMLLTSLEALRPERGDCVVFNNTSAEHPATYIFLAKLKKRAEKAGVPFFYTQFQTYEEYSRYKVWGRQPTYRLVNSQPYSSDNSNGFRWRGEVFEELLSWKGMLPNKFQRICTAQLKVEITAHFLRDWFEGKVEKKGPTTSKADIEDLWRIYKQHRGISSKENFLRRKKCVLNAPSYRPAQAYEDFSLPRPNFKAKYPNYVSLVGLRADEHSRIVRVHENSSRCTKHGGYHTYTPLNSSDIKLQDVENFWRDQDFELGIPPQLSNCTFCFLKGASGLQIVREFLVEPGKLPGFGTLEGSPSDIDWWAKIEHNYARNRLGFFGKRKVSYASLSAGQDLHELKEEMLPCDCTD